MFKSHFRIAWRSILRYKVYTAVNIIGLSLGICACMVIYLIVSHEFSYDSFHPGRERIFRVRADITESTGDNLHFARVPLGVSIEARDRLAGIETIGALVPFNAKIIIPAADGASKQFESRPATPGFITTVLAQPEYFSVFQYQWRAGDATTSMQTPYSVVLTESRARQYFGTISPAQMIGKRIIYADSLQVSVTGIIKDWKKNTDLSFTDFISFSTIGNSFLKNTVNASSWGQRDLSAWVFTKLAKGIKPSQVNGQLNLMVKTFAKPEDKLSLWLEPLSAIHFNADIIENPLRTAHMPTLYSLIGIALFILLLAIINFINLSTAQSVYRSREVGVRKVLGSSRSSLVFQFLAETFILTLFALILALCMVPLTLNTFRSFIPDGVSFHLFQSSTVAFIILIMIATSLLAGFYPASVLSSSLPVTILKGPGRSKGPENWLIRKGLIVFQFTVSLVFIIGSIIVATQMKYTREKDLGFRADAIITLDTPRGDSLSKIPLLAQKIRQIPDVLDVALQWISPMTDNARGMKLKFKSTDEKDFWVTQVAGNENFIPLYDIKLLAGRNLFRTDSVKEFVINESLSRLMGDDKPEASLGRTLYWNDKPYPVIGVVADFHTSSLHDPMTPLCIINRPERQGSIAIKLASKAKHAGSMKTALSALEKTWKQVYPATTFTYKFYDESLALLYKKDQQTAALMNTSTLVTIFISCIGLFGLALFTAGKRAKEISIRKILGAGITDIAVMLGREFIVLVIIALLIATPVAWYFMDQWLRDFTYRIHIRWWIFIIAGINMLFIALITISFHSIKAALVNPVKNLRRE